MSQVFYGGSKIAGIGKLTVSGSGKAIVRTIPNTYGALITPNSNPTRNITVNCFDNIANKTKNNIEVIHYSLSRFLASNKTNKNLQVNGNTYTDVSIASNAFDQVTHNEYYTFKISAIINHTQGLLNSLVSRNQIRVGTFTYNFYGLDGSLATTTFIIIGNYEVANSVSFIQQEKPRISFDDGRFRNHQGGFNSLKLDCWTTGCPPKDMESYMVNILIGPLGRSGTLNISGKTFENVILNNVSSQEFVGRSMKYSLEFISTIC